MRSCVTTESASKIRLSSFKMEPREDRLIRILKQVLLLKLKCNAQAFEIARLKSETLMLREQLERVERRLA